MTPYYADEAVTLHHGDALEVLRALPDASVDAVVTDPPYGLEFMGRDWDAPWKRGFAETGYTDAQRLARPNFGSTRNPMCRTCRKHKRGTDRCVCATPDFDETPADSSRLFGRWCETWAAECLRVLKPGGYLLAFGGTRTVHRLTCAIEDAGFEIRDGIDWLYASGFPKSLDVSKAIDKAAGAQREVVGTADRKASLGSTGILGASNMAAVPVVTAPATDDARRWAGWGTALKPAREPIVMARKPLAGTVAGTVLAHGTGALNIDACRVGDSGGARRGPEDLGVRGRPNDVLGSGLDLGNAAPRIPGLGRWPSNVVLSHAPDCTEGTFRAKPESLNGAAGDSGFCLPGCPVAELDRQSGIGPGNRPSRKVTNRDDDSGWGFAGRTIQDYADAGGASRFFPVFRYEAKAPTAERPRTADGTAHPTVKPLDLMRWLVRLVTPPGGTVLEPFAGSGTTAEACVLEGFRCVAIEREAAYLPLITARLAKPLQPALVPFPTTRAEEAS